MSALPMEGGLLGMDPSQYTLSDDERRKQALTYLLLNMGAAAANSRKGQLVGGLAAGAASGAQQGAEAIHNAQMDKFRGLQTQGAMYDLAAKKQTYQDQADERAGLIDYYKSKSRGNVPPPDAPPQYPAGSDAMAAPGDPANSPPPQVAPQRPTVSPGTKSQQYQELSDFYAGRGNAPAAQKYADLASQHAPKLKEQKTLTQNGKRVVVNFYSDGTHEVLPDVGPDQEKAHFLDTGSMVGAVDPFTGQPVQGGGQYNKTMTPGETAGNKIAQGNLNIAGAHLRLAQDKASQEKGEQYGTPIQITTPDGGTQLMIPKKGTNQVVPMMDASGQPVSKSASIPQAYKDKAYTLANLRGAIEDYQKELNNFSITDYASPTAITNLKAKHGVARMGLKGAFELGVINGPDMELLNNNLVDPASLQGIAMPKSAFKAQNDTLTSMLTRQEHNLAKAYNQRAPESAKSIVRTGTEKGTGRKVVEYSDGTRGYQ